MLNYPEPTLASWIQYYYTLKKRRIVACEE